MPRSPRRRHRAARSVGSEARAFGVGGNLEFWYDFGDINTLFQDTSLSTPVTANGQAIKGVVDKSGRGNSLNVTSATGPTYVTNSINGLAAADFVAAESDKLGRATLVQGTIPQPSTEFAVIDLDLANLQQITDSFASAGNRTSIWIDSGGSINVYGGASVDTNVLPGTNPVIIVAQYNSTSTKGWVNGGAAATGNGGTQSRVGVLLGIEQAGTANPMDGRFAENIYFGRLLTLAEINTIGAALGTKFGITWTTAT